MKQFNIFIIHCFKDDLKALDSIIASVTDKKAIIVISHDPYAKKLLTIEKQYSNKITAEFKIMSVEKL